MERSFAGTARRLLGAAVLALCLVQAPAAQAAGSRDVLWDIISNCLNPQAADYCTSCRSPRVDSACAAELICKQTTEVWAETAQFVVIRDRKSCGCPGDFVHGLAIPRDRVTGVEDPNRPAGIWQLAWDTALKKIPDSWNAAVAVNPAGARAQDQLHVHVLRLREDARENFAKARVCRIEKLDEVWSRAGKLAEAAGYGDYGVLVARHPDGGFMVVVGPESPEKKYTIERCKGAGK